MDRDQELFEHYKFIADRGQDPLRVDRFLLNFIENATRNKIQRSIKDGFVFVNGKSVKSNYKVKAGDVVTVEFLNPKRDKILIPQDIPIDIQYEDDDIIIVNKEAGMVVHPGFGNYDGTLVNGLAFHFKNLPNMGDETRPGLVHRIDKNTSGILVIAKNDRSMSIMGDKFLRRDLDRRYYALVWGDFDEDEGTIVGHIGRSHKNRKIMDVFEDGEYGKEAITNWKVIERFGYTTLVECKLETGRTHQIRVHLKHKGTSILGDQQYGKKNIKFKKINGDFFNILKNINGQALHAQTLEFLHPIKKKWMSFKAPHPNDFKKMLNYLSKLTG